MGNCVSCTEPHEQPERWLTDGDKKIAELQTSGSLGGGAGGGMSGRGADGGGGGGAARDGFGNGSCTSGSTSTSHNHHHHSHMSPMDGAGGPNTISSQRAEKKTFYSRIPPLGRSGSDKKSSIISSSNSSAIRDNNNAYSETKIAAVFDVYKDTHEDLILAEGIEKLCKDLEVKPEDFKVLVLAWKFGAEQMCRFTREEFYRGMRELKTDNVKGIQARLPDCVAEVLSDPAMFKDLYRFAFRFGLDTELGQRILPVEMATSLWRVVFSQREPPMLDRWVSFLEAHPQIRGIPRDTWNMFLNFVETVDNDLSTYDDTEAWPSLFDDFVEYENDRLNQNITSTVSVVVSADKADQHLHHMAIDDYTSMMMMTTTIPPPAQFGDCNSSFTSSNNCSNNKTNSSMVKVVPAVTTASLSHHHHTHQLMAIDTSSTSGYTKIIHTPSPLSPTSTTSNNSSSNNCVSGSSVIPVVSHQLSVSSMSPTYDSPPPVSASSYTTPPTSAAPTKSGSESAPLTSTTASYPYGGYSSRGLSDV